MAASRTERRGAAAAIVALAALAVVGAPAPAAIAQEGSPAAGAEAPLPLRLEPARRPAEAQPGAAGAAPDAAGVGAGAGGAPVATFGGIQVDELGAVDRGSIGILTPSSGGVPLDIWRGTDFASVMRLIGGLPVSAESPAMRGTMRRLLLSQAATPAGDGESLALVVRRIRMLLAMGEAEAALELADAVPNADHDVALDRLAAEAQLIVGDTVAACRYAAQGVQEGEDIGFWDRLQVLCQALAEDTRRVELGLTMLRETGDAEPAFFRLIDAVVAGEPAERPGVETPTPLLVATAAASGSRLDDATVERAGMPVLVALALADGVVSPEARAEAAERAAPAGAIDAERLRDAYRALSFTDDDRNNALSRAADLPGVRSRGLLYQAASRETVPSARAEILGMAADVAADTGRPDAMAFATAPLFRQLPVSSDFLWLAPQAVRTMLRVGDMRSAMAWFGLIRKAAPNDAMAAAALARLAPLIEIGTDSSPLGAAAALGAWWDVYGGQDGGPAGAAVLAGMLGAFGHPIPAGFWTAVGQPDARVLAGSAPRVDPVAQLHLQATLAAPAVASAAVPTTTVSAAPEVTLVEGRSRRGEIAVLALRLLGAPGPAERPVGIGQQAVAALKAAGLPADARRLALEVLLSRGL